MGIWGQTNDSDSGNIFSTPQVTGTGKGVAPRGGGVWSPQCGVPAMTTAPDDIGDRQTGPDLRPPLGR